MSFRRRPCEHYRNKPKAEILRFTKRYFSYVAAFSVKAHMGSMKNLLSTFKLFIKLSVFFPENSTDSFMKSEMFWLFEGD